MLGVGKLPSITRLLTPHDPMKEATSSKNNTLDHRSWVLIFDLILIIKTPII